MPGSREEQFQAKQQLVALFKAQLELVRQADPQGAGRHLDAVDLAKYDRLLDGGPAARWPAGLLSGLKQGIRDLQFMLEIAYPASERGRIRDVLRVAGGEAAELLEAHDAERLAVIRKRKRIRTEDEYFLIRSAIERLEASSTSDRSVLQELYRLADETSAGGAA